MADYHIYLHSNEGSSLQNNLQPKDSKDSMGGAFSVKGAYNKISQFASGGFSGTINTGVASLSKAIPIVAAAVVMVKIADSVLETGFKHLESYTGNYQYSMEYNNFKTAVGNVVNPIGFFKKTLHLQAEQKKFNDKQNEYRKLMGERFIGV